MTNRGPSDASSFPSPASRWRDAPAPGLAFEDNGTLANLSALRSFKPVEDDGIDRDFRARPRLLVATPGDSVRRKIGHLRFLHEFDEFVDRRRLAGGRRGD